MVMMMTIKCEVAQNGDDDNSKMYNTLKQVHYCNMCTLYVGEKVAHAI